MSQTSVSVRLLRDATIATPQGSAVVLAGTTLSVSAATAEMLVATGEGVLGSVPPVTPTPPAPTVRLILGGVAEDVVLGPGFVVDPVAGTISAAAGGALSVPKNAAFLSGDASGSVQPGTLGTHLALALGVLDVHPDTVAAISSAGSLASGASQAASTASGVASAAGSLASSVGTSVSTLSSTVGTLSSAVSSVGSTVAGHTAQLGTLAGGVIASASTSGSTTVLKNSAGGTIATIVAPQGAPGTLGAGSVRTNTASTALGGPERTLAAIHSDRLRLMMFGAQQSGTTAQSLLGVTTRAALAAWTNPAGATPYAFAATQPFTMGDDYWLRLPLAVAATTGSGSTSAAVSTIPLSTTLTLASAGYAGQDGHWYLPAPKAAAVYADDMIVTGGTLASGTKVVAVQGSTIRITDQAAGTSIPSGTVLTIGADMSRVKVGQQVWATQGLAPLCSITAISGTTITLSAPLASAGLFALQTLNVYTPMAEGTLTNSVTMDMLAFCAAYAACPYGGVVECDPGSYVISPHIIVSGSNVSFVGTSRGSVSLQGTDAAPMVKMFPQQGATPELRNLSFSAFQGISQTFLEVDGSGFTMPQPNGAPAGVLIDGINGYCSGYGTIGAYELIRLRNLGNATFDNLDFIGLGKAVVGACTVNLASIVLAISRKVTSHYCWRAAIQQGYIEDPICEHWAQDQCGGAWDASRASTYNGICGLLFKWVGGDNDVTDFILNLPSFSGVNISDADVIFNGQNGGACYILAGCASGVISGVQGGTQAPGVVDCIHLTSAMVDGGYYPSTNILVQAVGVAGFDCAVRIDKGCSGNDVTATLWSAGTGSVNGISPTPVIDSDGRNRINGMQGTQK